MIRGGGGTAPGTWADGEATLADVRDVVRSFAISDLPIGPSDMAHELVHLRREIDALELRFSRTAARYADTHHWDDEGAVSPHQWIRLTCKMGGGAAAQRIAVGRQAGALPESVEALEGVDIGFAHLGLIARTAEALEGSSTARVFDEGPLLEQARTLSLRYFIDACHHDATRTIPKAPRWRLPNRSASATSS